MAATDFDFILTRTQILESAFEKIGAIAAGDTLTAEQDATGRRELNRIVKAMGEDDVVLWNILNNTISATIDQPYIALPTDEGLAYADQLFLRDSQGRDDALERRTWDEYQSIPNKSDKGRPIIFAQSVTEHRIYLYPVPNEAFNFRLRGVARGKDWDAANGVGNLPARWQQALVWGLAAELCHGHTLPIRERELIIGLAEKYYREARGKEKDVSSCSYVRGSY